MSRLRRVSDTKTAREVPTESTHLTRSREQSTWSTRVCPSGMSPSNSAYPSRTCEGGSQLAACERRAVVGSKWTWTWRSNSTNGSWGRCAKLVRRYHAPRYVTKLSSSPSSRVSSRPARVGLTSSSGSTTSREQPWRNVSLVVQWKVWILMSIFRKDDSD